MPAQDYPDGNRPATEGAKGQTALRPGRIDTLEPLPPMNQNPFNQWLKSVIYDQWVVGQSARLLGTLIGAK